MSGKHWVAAAFTMMFAAGCLGPEQPVPDVSGQSAPDFELTRLDGERIRLSDFRGKPVLLAFWAYG